MHRMVSRFVVPALFVVVLTLVLNSCATDPEILASYGQYEDADLAAYLGALGKRLGAVSHQPDIPYTFKVLDNSVVNAFAVPGGYVYLTRGILAYLNDEAELAGVISHGVGHIAARYNAQQYSKAQAAQLGLGIGSILPPTFAKLAGLAEAGISMLFLSFSRENERQADDLGVRYSSKAGFDARQTPNLFVTLERPDPSGGSDGLPAWFSTHPNPPDRIVAIKKTAEEWQKANPQAAVAMNPDRYPQQLDGLVFGEGPRRGYVAGQVFYHPELRFQFPVPAGWTVNNTAPAAFDGRLGTFETSMKGFRNLTDSARISVKPDRVALRKVSRAGTLRQVLPDLGVSQDGLEAHAIMNGKELMATVAANALLKVVVDY